MITKAVIWKYDLEYRETELEVPRGSQIVHVDEQFGALRVWMMVNPHVEEMETKLIRVVHTGETFFPREVKSRIRTVLMKGGSYVAHVLEV